MGKRTVRRSQRDQREKILSEYHTSPVDKDIRGCRMHLKVDLPEMRSRLNLHDMSKSELCPEYKIKYEQ